MNRSLFFAVLSLIFLTTLCFSTTVLADISKKKQTSLGLYMSASEAYSYLKKHSKNTLFLDIRTRSEIAFLGMPTDADANIPYMLADDWSNWDEKKKNYKLAPNSDFLTQVEKQLSKKGLSKDSVIILMCRSGSRSAKAANLMSKAGFKKVYTITDGFEGDKAHKGEHKGERVVNGWKNSGLPWTYKLDKNKLYWNM